MLGAEEKDGTDSENVLLEILGSVVEKPNIIEC